MDDRITNVKCSIDTVYGVVSDEWEVRDGIFVCRIEIPCNTTAQIVLPNGTTRNVSSGKYEFQCKL